MRSVRGEPRQFFGLTQELLAFAERKFAEPKLKEEPPSGVEYIWRWFLHLSRRRSITFVLTSDGVRPEFGWILDSEIQAFSQVMQYHITPVEADVVHQLDYVFIKSSEPKPMSLAESLIAFAERRAQSRGR